MFNQILNFGTALSKKEQQTIKGGKVNCINSSGACTDCGPQCAQYQCQDPSSCITIDG